MEDKMKIVEKRFRGSIVCRVLSYPIAYGIVKLLLEKKEMNLEQIAVSVKRAKSTACFHLAKLRLVNIIRYEHKAQSTIYWVKYPNEVKKVLIACEQLADRISKRLNVDF